MFDLGTTIGQMPQQYRAKQTRDANASELAGIRQGSPEFYEALSRQAAAAGDSAKAAQYAEAARRVARLSVVEGREDTAYEREKAAEESQKNASIATSSLMKDRLQAFIDNENTSPEDRAKASNLMKAINAAGELGGEKFSARVDKLVSEDLSHIISVGGGVVYDKKTGQFSSMPSSGKIPTQADVLEALADEYTADSILKSYDQETGKFSTETPLVRIAEEPKTGSITTTAEKWLQEKNEAAAKADVSIQRNMDLEARLLSNPSYTGGIAGELRTVALGAAGLRDASEEDKTAFLRTRNTEIIQGLPPGVASDRDIQIFSQGLPPENAGRDEIISYLRGERKVARMTADMAMLADNMLARKRQAGEKADTVGFQSQKAAYRRALEIAVSMLESAPPEQKMAVAEEARRMLIKSIGFVPSALGEYL